MRAVLTCLAVFSTALLLAGPAPAQEPPPAPPDSAVSQYVEAVPAAEGDKAPGAGPRGKPRPLAVAVRAQLKATGGADARALEQLVTSRQLGAPARRAPGRERSVVRPRDDSPSASGALSAAVNAAGDGGDTRFAILGLALVGITAAVLMSARRRMNH